jgi:hypothetical protein
MSLNIDIEYHLRIHVTEEGIQECCIVVLIILLFGRLILLPGNSVCRRYLLGNQQYECAVFSNGSVQPAN